MRGFFTAAALIGMFQDPFGPFRSKGGETADQRAKRENRIRKEEERLASNRSRSAPDASRETRQQVSAEGRRLEKHLRARQRQQDRSARRSAGKRGSFFDDFWHAHRFPVARLSQVNSRKALKHPAKAR